MSFGTRFPFSPLLLDLPALLLIKQPFPSIPLLWDSFPASHITQGGQVFYFRQYSALNADVSVAPFSYACHLLKTIGVHGSGNTEWCHVILYNLGESTWAVCLWPEKAESSRRNTTFNSWCAFMLLFFIVVLKDHFEYRLMHLSVNLRVSAPIILWCISVCFKCSG